MLVLLSARVLRTVQNSPRHCRVNGTPIGRYVSGVMRLGDSSYSLSNLQIVLQLDLLRMKSPAVPQTDQLVLGGKTTPVLT